MKTLKIWSMMMLAVMMMLLAMGCSKDSDDGPKDSELEKLAIGTWMCVESTDTQQNGASYSGLMIGKQVTINSDRTFTSTASSFGYSGTYTISGNKITAKSSSGTFVVTVSISGDRMTWNGTASNGVRFKYVFVRE
jgi:hypothetical protein